MSVSSSSKQKVRKLLIICAASILAGIIYQYMDVGFVDYNAFVLGFLIGLGFGIFELFFMSKINRLIKSYPLPAIILINVFLYTLLVFIISNLTGLVSGYFAGRSLEEFYDSLLSVKQFILIGYSILLFTILISFFQINRLLGKGVLSKLLLARYHKPVEEERIIMFLDLTSSSEIAERLSPQKYSLFLKDFFLDLDDAISDTKGFVFQYVGDEVVIIWNRIAGIQNNNCIRLFFLAKRIFELKKDAYLNKYGFLPGFKAGIHFGNIVITEIGGTKQELAYHGDTINTAARIRSTCHSLNSELLISAELLSILTDVDKEFHIESVGISNFKGKKNIVGLFSVKKI
ncbi:MAG: adenylate/guanylate cyclase domain-containing protein [Melioribacteraceae bacterium]|nr:adenylate/guanylate cyclase domain-containing protein [Melioribacteraceae bacterium]